MDPSPYEDNYLVHLCFHYVEKYFFSLCPTFYFLAQITRDLYFLILNPSATKEGSPSYRHPPLLFDGGWSMNPGVERQGTGTCGGCGRDRGWTKDQGEKQEGGERCHGSQGKYFNQ